ncbi:MAG TPA: transglutaminase domain-containing protein [Verrucomicrobiae bacterium]|nr:transglutaminase domain-containing protein [Verrucomicrobiae bacterium]
MKTPPMLVGAALIFWGWQTGYLWAGAVMAMVLEGSRLVKARWDFSDEDFNRIWTVCTLLFLGAAVIAFTDNGGPARFSHFFQNPNLASQTGVGLAAARTGSAILRWLPMVLFLFIAAQAFSSREEIPVTTISLLLRLRWQKARKLGRPLPAVRGMNFSHAYFATCLFAASVHSSAGRQYFWGFCALLAWALWTHRTRRFRAVTWATAMAVVFALGYYGQHGIAQFQSYVQNLDPNWFMHLARRRGVSTDETRTAIGDIGRLKLSGKIVIRLSTEGDAEPPPYLREASYQLFTRSREWRVGRTNQTFEVVSPETNNLDWILLPEKIAPLRVQIACFLPDDSPETGARMGVLPLPTGCARLENLPVFSVKKNLDGAVVAEGPGLVMFDALYGPGATIDAPFEPDERMATNSFFLQHHRRFSVDPKLVTNTNYNPDLFVPAREQPALNEVISQLHITTTNTAEILRVVGSFFQNHFKYSTWQARESRGSRTNETQISRFLLSTHEGHCEYFATATVLLLRQLGIPARYAIGYAVHEKSAGGGYVVRLRDGHSWCLVWNAKRHAWEDFDTTPAIWMQDNGRSWFERISDAWSWVEFQFARFRWGQTNLRPYLLLALAPVVLVLLYQIFFRRKRRLRAGARDSQIEWPGVDSEFYLVEKSLARRGIVRKPGESFSDWIQRAESDPEIASAAAPLRELLKLHYRYRFDPRGLSAEDRRKLRVETEAFLKAITEPRREVLGTANEGH